ncbi:MAG: M1 family aminopeptidase [candidate division Zixibacteria bacterium]|jgi:hypothetical protein|nr:M1 family aminopeptidase [candidate division Zixibacteria bacterium]
MRWLRLTALIPAFCAVAAAKPPADSSVWTEALRQMQQARLDTVALEIDSRTIVHHSYTFHIDSGTLYPARPVPTESGPVRWAYYFRGRARFRFVPPVSIERDQLRRFYDVDSLDEAVGEALFLCDDSIRSLLEDDGLPVQMRPEKSVREAFDEFLEPLVQNENHAFTFSALRSIVHPRSEPFLLSIVRIKRRGLTAYMYDPYRREPVSLYRDHDIPGERFMELVCSYVSDIDETYATINGASTDQLLVHHIDIDATISGGGEYRGRATVACTVRDSTVQFVPMALHEKLKVDSIRNEYGLPVPFMRYTSDSHKSEALFVLLPDVRHAGDSISLSLFYHGDIAKREVGEFKVEAGASWYPRYGLDQRHTYSLKFRTPRDVTLIASAELLDSATTGDTLYTRWTVDRPARNISFNVGWFTRYDFTDSGLPPVALYYNEWLHQYILKGSGRNVYKDVGSDVVGAVRLFSKLFGAFPFEQLVIGEIIYPHGESFPGFIHMGANTFVSTDHWGEDHLFRSHEVAHQWWGSSLDYQTYHDQWLSEGFATYASLLYLQQEKGDERYYDKLGEYADEVISARKYLFFDGAESGPIILGRRTASTRTEGDYDLIIYKKGALVLHMLRTCLTDWTTRDDSRFFSMLADFYGTYAGRAVSTTDFRRMVEKHTRTDMGWFFDQWVYHNELPEYRFAYDIVADTVSGGWQANCRVTRDGGSESFCMLMPFEIEYADRSKDYAAKWVDERSSPFSLYVKKPVRKIKMNPFAAVLARVKQ